MKRFWAYLLTIAMLFSIIALPIQAAVEPYATLTVEDTTAYAGQKVSVYVSIDDCTIRSMGFSPAYPSDKVELLSGRWLIEGDMRAGWDAVSNLPVIAYSQATQVGGDIFVFVFRVFDEVEAGEQIEISLPTVRVRDGEDDLASAVGVSGVITVLDKNVTPADTTPEMTTPQASQAPAPDAPNMPDPEAPEESAPTTTIRPVDPSETTVKPAQTEGWGSESSEPEASEETPDEPKADVQAYFETVTANAGEEVKVYLWVSSCQVKVMGFTLVYDEAFLQPISGKWLIDAALKSNWNASTNFPVITFDENTALEGPIFVFTFRVLEDAAPDAALEVGFGNLYIKMMDDNDREIPLTVEKANGAVIIGSMQESGPSESTTPSDTEPSPDEPLLEYLINDDGISCTITGIGKETSKELVIPEKIDGYIVTAIDMDAFKDNNDIVSVEIPASVTSIGSRAFYDCRMIEKVTFAEGSQLQIIGNSAFYMCFRLKTIDIPDAVTTIGKNAFQSSDLETVRFGRNSKLELIDNYAFYSCNNLKKFEIPSTVKTIGESALWSTRLESIMIPASVTSIGDSAFQHTSNLEKVTFAQNCKLRSLGATAFYGCYNLRTIELPASLEFIGASAFYNSGLQTITIPASVKEISSSAFERCEDLTSVFFEDGSKLKVLPSNLFAECDWLETVQLPAALTTIEGFVFRDCTRLQSIIYGGTAARWNAIVKEEEYYPWNENAGAFIVYTRDQTAVLPDDALDFEGDDAVVDLNDAQSAVDSITIGKNTMDRIDANLSIKLPDIDLSFDADAMASIRDQANGKDLTIGAKPSEKEDLNDAQKAALKDKDAHLMLDLHIQAGDDTIGNFDGGKVQVDIPFILPDGVTGDDLCVIYLAPSALIAIIPCTYENGTLSFVTTHFSDYLVMEKSDVSDLISGDFNGNLKVDSNDALYLLRYTVNSARFPITQQGDINKNGRVDSNDALYLLRHTVNPDRFPLN